MRLLPLSFLTVLLLSGVAAAAGSSVVPEATDPQAAMIAEPLRDDPEHWACCHQYTWECFMLTEQECAWIDGIWFPGSTCDPNP
jgi:hypothetical protein